MHTSSRAHSAFSASPETECRSVQNVPVVCTAFGELVSPAHTRGALAARGLAPAIAGALPPLGSASWSAPEGAPRAQAGRPGGPLSGVPVLRLQGLYLPRLPKNLRPSFQASLHFFSCPPLKKLVFCTKARPRAVPSAQGPQGWPPSLPVACGLVTDASGPCFRATWASPQCTLRGVREGPPPPALNLMVQGPWGLTFVPCF